jgi:hypothetical protein
MLHTINNREESVSVISEKVTTFRDFLLQIFMQLTVV